MKTAGRFAIGPPAGADRRPVVSYPHRGPARARYPRASAHEDGLRAGAVGTRTVEREERPVRAEQGAEPVEAEVGQPSAHPDVIIYALRLDRGLSPARVLKTEPGTHWDEERGLNNIQYIVPGAGGVGEILNNAWL